MNVTIRYDRHIHTGCNVLDGLQISWTFCTRDKSFAVVIGNVTGFIWPTIRAVLCHSHEHALQAAWSEKQHNNPRRFVPECSTWVVFSQYNPWRCFWYSQLIDSWVSNSKQLFGDYCSLMKLFDALNIPTFKGIYYQRKLPLVDFT